MSFLVPSQVGKVSRTKVCNRPPKQLEPQLQLLLLSRIPCACFWLCSRVAADPMPSQWQAICSVACGSSFVSVRSTLSCNVRIQEVDVSRVRAQIRKIFSFFFGKPFTSILLFSVPFTCHWLAHHHPTRKASVSSVQKIVSFLSWALIFNFLYLKCKLTAWSFLIDVKFSGPKTKKGSPPPQWSFPEFL
jgi:hypothetical protein